jgi:hypothetical protein
LNSLKSLNTSLAEVRKSVQKIDASNVSLRASPLSSSSMSEISGTAGNAVLRMPYTASLQLPLSASPPTLPPSSSRIANTSRLLEPTLDWDSSLYPQQFVRDRATTITTTTTEKQHPLLPIPTFTPRGVVMDAALGGLSPLSARILSRLDNRPVESRDEEDKKVILPGVTQIESASTTTASSAMSSAISSVISSSAAATTATITTTSVLTQFDKSDDVIKSDENVFKATNRQSSDSSNISLQSSSSSSTPATLTASALVLRVLMSPAFRGVGVDEGTLDELTTVLTPEDIGNVRQHMAFRPTPSVGLGLSASSSGFVPGSRWSDRGSSIGGEGDSDGGGSRTRTPGSTHSRTHTPPPPSWHMPGAGPGHFPHEPHRPNSENRRGRTPVSDSKTNVGTNSIENENSGRRISRGRTTPVRESSQQFTQQQQQVHNHQSLQLQNSIGSRDSLIGDGDLSQNNLAHDGPQEVGDEEEADDGEDREENFDDEDDEEDIGADGDGSVGGSHGGGYSGHQRQHSGSKSNSSVRFGGAEEIPQLEGEGEDGVSFVFASGGRPSSSARSQLSSPRFAGDGFGGTTDDDFTSTPTEITTTTTTNTVDIDRISNGSIVPSASVSVPDTGSGMPGGVGPSYSEPRTSSLTRRVGFNDETQADEGAYEDAEYEEEEEEIERGEEYRGETPTQEMERIRQRGIEEQALRGGFSDNHVSSSRDNSSYPIDGAEPKLRTSIMSTLDSKVSPSSSPSQTLISSAAVGSDSDATRIFTFVRYNDNKGKIQNARGEDDVPYYVHEIPESEFYEEEASVGLLPLFDGADAASAFPSAGFSSEVPSSLPVISPGQVPLPGLAILRNGVPLPSPYSIIDTSTPPKVFDWNGGDVEWAVSNSSNVAHIDGGVQHNTPRYEAFTLRVVYEAGRTGFEEEKEFSAEVGSTIAGRYKVVDYIGSAAFSSALSCTDLITGDDVCLKVIKNSKDFLDQSLDEIKLLRYINAQGDADANHILRIREYFYHKEHLFIVTELLKDNLYEFGKYLSDHGYEPFFTLPRIQRIAIQTLKALAFIHTRGLIHCDLKPENILIKSYSKCEVKVIDFGSSCYFTDRLSVYIQSRSYRAPEVVLGLPYNPKIDIWSLGCILAELLTGKVLFANDSVQTMLARIQSLFGPFPPHMLERGRDVHKYFRANRKGSLFEREESNGGNVLILSAQTTNLHYHLGCRDEGFLEFVSALLAVDPDQRPTAEQALKHPWLQEILPCAQYQLPS